MMNALVKLAQLAKRACPSGVICQLLNNGQKFSLRTTTGDIRDKHVQHKKSM